MKKASIGGAVMKRTALALTLVLGLLLSAIAGTLFVKPVNARTITVPQMTIPLFKVP